MRRFATQDAAAALVSIALVIGVIVLGVTNKEIPDILNIALGSSATWLFARSAQQFNDHVTDIRDERETAPRGEQSDHT